ncbi:MAG: hypothetical protein ACJ71H_02525 [Nitrososphaeraceae archaeon]
MILSDKIDIIAQKITRTKSIPAVLAAALYIAYRELGVSKTMKDILQLAM